MLYREQEKTNFDCKVPIPLQHMFLGLVFAARIHVGPILLLRLGSTNLLFAKPSSPRVVVVLSRHRQISLRVAVSEPPQVASGLLSDAVPES